MARQTVWITAPLQLSVIFFCYDFHLGPIKAHMITQPPENTTAALGADATFSCHGTGSVLWQINGTQVQDASQLPIFSNVCVFVPLPNDSSSELIVTASTTTNASLTIVCVVQPSPGVQPWSSIKSSPVQLLVYAEPNPPVDLNITVEGLILVVVWSKPFSLKGEELSYIITITNTANRVQEEAVVNSTIYTFSIDEPIRERDCAEYMFTIFSNNSYSKSSTGVSDYENIPTVPLLMRRSDVSVDVSLVKDIEIMITFNPRDPCPAYPVESYVFNISEDSGYVITTINHIGNTSLNINGSDHGLLYNQVYHLMIEAVNAIGSTYSEEIVFYTTGLQSSTAVVELNGSITVTCIFATGASSTGCQVTIFGINDTGMQTLFMINRPNGILEVARNFKVHGLINYNTLIVQTMEMGGIGNITINATIFESTFPSTIPPVQVPGPAEDQYNVIIIIGVVVTITLVLLVLIIAAIIIFMGILKRKALYSRSHDQAEHIDGFGRSLTSEHAYETINSLRQESLGIRSVDNPGYRSESEMQAARVNDRSRYAKIQPSRNQVHSHDRVTTAGGLNSRYLHPQMSDNSASISQVPSPYLIPQPSFGKDNQIINLGECYETTNERLATCYTNTVSHVVPTDPRTGYSTLLRPDALHSHSVKLNPMDPLYDSIKEKNVVMLAQMNNPHSTSPLDAKSQASSCRRSSNDPSKLNLFESTGTTRVQAASSEAAVVPIDNPETGYSELRPDKVPYASPLPGEGSVPHYDTIKLQLQDSNGDMSRSTKSMLTVQSMLEN